MNMETPIAQKTPAESFRAECVDWIKQFEPTLFITFVFNRDVSPAEAQRRLEAFHMRLDRKLLGRAMLRKPDERSSYIATIENPQTNIHIHGLFKMTERQRLIFGLVAREIWLELAPGGNLDIQAVTYVEGVAAYVTKALRPETSERLLLPCHLDGRASKNR
jgi:hypothetical protein